MRDPVITIGMPALDEANYIADAIASILPDEDVAACELIVADGGSSDSTVDIVQRLAERDPRIRLVHNPGRSQAAGMNLIAASAHPGSAVLVRADCHAKYPEKFVETCVAALSARGVASVVVPMQAEGRSCAQRAIACAQNSLIGNGGAAHRRTGQPSRTIDHGHHAAFVLDVFRRLGGYDETLRANEDAELDARIVASGRRIWLCGEAVIAYYPRPSFRALGSQYARYGSGRAAMLRMSGVRPKARQVLPLLASSACGLSLALGLVDVRLTAPAAVYYLLCLSWGLLLGARRRQTCLLAAGVAAVVMHHAWAFGFLRAAAAARFARPRRQLAWAGAREPGRLL